MPIYEYECEQCHQVFEVSQRMSDPPVSSHECGSTQVKRLISRTSFQLKGSGWYASGYESTANQSSAPAPKTDTPTASESPAAAPAATSTEAAK